MRFEIRQWNSLLSGLFEDRRCRVPVHTRLRIFQVCWRHDVTLSQQVSPESPKVGNLDQPVVSHLALIGRTPRVVLRCDQLRVQRGLDSSWKLLGWLLLREKEAARDID